MKFDSETVDIARTILQRYEFGASNAQIMRIVGAVLEEQDERKLLAEHLKFMDIWTKRRRELTAIIAANDDT